MREVKLELKLKRGVPSGRERELKVKLKLKNGAASRCKLVEVGVEEWWV